MFKNVQYLVWESAEDVRITEPSLDAFLVTKRFVQENKVEEVKSANIKTNTAKDKLHFFINSIFKCLRRKDSKKQ